MSSEDMASTSTGLTDVRPMRAVARVALVRPLDLAQGAALALAYFAIAATSFHAFGALTPVWFANAVAVAALLRKPPHVWPLWLVMLWVAETLALKSIGTESAMILSLPDMGEILLVTWALSRAGGAVAAFTSESGLVRYFALCMLVPLLSSSLGSAIIASTSDALFFDAALQWYAGAVLGLLIVGPMLMIWSTPELRRRSVGPPAQTALLTLGLAGFALVIFNVSNAAYLFLTFPALLLLVWVSGLIGATTGIAALLGVGLYVTLTKGGAIASLLAPVTGVVIELQALQIYIAALGFSALPLAVVLANQRELSRTLAETADARGQFLAAMSHEIRTPMTGVLGMIELLEVEKLTPRQLSYVDAIRSSGRHLLTIINDILDFSRIETGTIELEHIDFSLPMVLERTRSMLNPLARDRGLDLRFELAEQSPPVIKGDPTRLKQVLLNLAGNAIKFTDEGSVVVAVTCDRSGDGFRLRFEVRDTGIGIPADIQNDLFNAFIQADRTTSRRYGGSGLGLAISKRLVEAMGGAIGFSSAVGSGSTFWFELPFEQGCPIKLPPQRAAAAAPIAPRRILVAEDVQLNRDLIRAVLEREGHRVTFAETGREALGLVRRLRFDLVIMDVHMPVMDGIEATRLIRQLAPPAGDIPIIGLTANVMAAEQEKCVEAGMNEVLMKPIEWDRVRAAIARYPVVGAKAGASGRKAPAAAPATADAAADAPAAAAADSGDEPRFVEAIFAKAREHLPPEVLGAHVATLEAEVAALASARAAAGSAALELAALEAAAHRIVSQAGTLGLMRLSARAAAVERACRTKEGIEAALERFVEAAPDMADGMRRPPRAAA